MAFSYTGFDGTLDEVRAALRDKWQGSVYAFGGPNDFKPTVAAGADRTISFAAGQAYGKFVEVTSDVAVTKQTGSVGSGSRWDTFVLRRNWAGTGGTATVEVVQGTATKAPAGGLNSVSGSTSLDDQLLCLGRVTAGQAAIQEIVDLRTWPARATMASSLAAVKDPYYGQRVIVNGVEYAYVLDTSNNLNWTMQGTATTTFANSIAGASGFTATSPMVSSYTVDPTGTDVQYDIQLRLTTASFQFSSSGTLADKVVCTLSGPKPDGPNTIPVTFLAMGGVASNTADTIPAWGYLYPDGRVVLCSSLPNLWIGQRLSADNISLRAHIQFRKAAA